MCPSLGCASSLWQAPLAVVSSPWVLCCAFRLGCVLPERCRSGMLSGCVQSRSCEHPSSAPGRATVVSSVVTSCTVALVVRALVGTVCAIPAVVPVAMSIATSVVALSPRNQLAIVATVAVPVAKESLHVFIVTAPCVLHSTTVMTTPHSSVPALPAAIFRSHCLRKGRSQRLAQ